MKVANIYCSLPSQLLLEIGLYILGIPDVVKVLISNIVFVFVQKIDWKTKLYNKCKIKHQLKMENQFVHLK